MMWPRVWGRTDPAWVPEPKPHSFHLHSLRMPPTKLVCQDENHKQRMQVNHQDPAPVAKRVWGHLGPSTPPEPPAELIFPSETSTLGVEPAEWLPGQSTESGKIINRCFKPLTFGFVMQQMVTDTPPETYSLKNSENALVKKPCRISSRLCSECSGILSSHNKKFFSPISCHSPLARASLALITWSKLPPPGLCLCWPFLPEHFLHSSQQGSSHHPHNFTHLHWWPCLKLPVTPPKPPQIPWWTCP